MVGMILGSLAVGYVAPQTDEGPAYDFRRSMGAITESPRLLRVTVAQMFLGAGFVGAAPLYAFVHVDRLQLSLSEVGVLGSSLPGRPRWPTCHGAGWRTGAGGCGCSRSAA